MRRLENWRIITQTVSPFQAPELGVTVLGGNIYGDDRFSEGATITTSRLLYFNSEENIAKTKSGVYSLGERDLSFKSYLTSSGYNISDYDFDIRKSI